MDIICPAHIPVIREYFNNKGKNYTSYLFRLEWKNIVELFLQRVIPANTNDIKESELEKLLGLCENEIKTLANNMETYTMLFWSRRLAPLNIFNLASASVGLYREVMTLAIFKYGKPATSLSYESDLFPASFMSYIQFKDNSDMDISNTMTWPTVCYELDNIVRLEVLCAIYIQITQFYRWQAKGARVFIENQTMLKEASEDTKKLVKLYDRRILNANIFSHQGMRFPLKKSEKKLDLLVAPVLNIDHEIKFPISLTLPSDKGSKSVKIINPNYLTPAIDLDSLSRFLRPYGRAITAEFGFSIESFITFLKLLNNTVILSLLGNLSGTLEFFNRAYVPIQLSSKDPITDLVNLVSKGDKSTQSYQQHEELLKVATYLIATDKTKIDLWTRNPKKMFYELDNDFWMLDMTQMIYAITDLMSNIVTRSDELSNVRSHDFENQLKDAIITQFGQRSLWVSQQRLQGRIGEKEIDAAFSIGNTLYILEAKAMYLPLDYDCGKSRELKKRKDKLRKALKQVKEKVKFIKEEKDYLHTPNNEGNKVIPLPRGIKHIKYIVITNFPEYIWSTEDDKFLDKEKELPVIMTIEELSLLKPKYKNKFC